MTTPALSQEVLKELLDYDLITGVFTWLERSRKHFSSDRTCRSWNTKFKGKVAGHVGKDKYRYISILGHTHLAHRLVFLYMTGSYPPYDVDHEDGNCDDNRWHKIHAATPAENGKNRRIPTTNTSGHMGVCWQKSCNKWAARITANGKSKHLGSFADIEDAITARKAANIEHGYHSNHGRA